MSAIPYMPLYVADYLADAAHLTTEEHGAYLLLIMNYWQRGEPLPAAPERLARICRLSNERWTDVEQTLSEFFEVRDGAWYHSRIEAELSKVRAKSEKAKQAGLASAKGKRAAGVQRTLNERSTSVEQTLNHSDTDTDVRETTAREDSALIERKLREAAGWERETAPSLFVTGPIEALIANGADLELDVLPVIRGLAPKVRRPSTWNYFVGAIQDAVAARRAATTGPPAKQPVAFPRNPGRTQNGTRNTIAAGFEIIDRAIEQRERQLAEAEGGQGCREDDPLALPRLREGTA